MLMNNDRLEEDLTDSNQIIHGSDLLKEGVYQPGIEYRLNEIVAEVGLSVQKIRDKWP